MLIKTKTCNIKQDPGRVSEASDSIKVMSFASDKVWESMQEKNSSSAPNAYASVINWKIAMIRHWTHNTHFQH